MGIGEGGGTSAFDIADVLGGDGDGSDLMALMALGSLGGLNLGGTGTGAGASGGFGSQLLSMMGLGGVAAGASSSGILGALGGLTGGNPLGALMAIMTGGSIFGSLMGSDTGKVGVAGRQDNAMLGGLLGGLGMFGAIWGSVGGGLMPLLAAMGPLGWGLMLGAGLLGAFGGSMFGDHFPISDEPDIGEPVVGGVNYGQFVSNMNGTQGPFNGQTMNPMSQFQGQDNNEAYQLETDIQKVLGMPNAPPALKQLAKQLQQLNPGNKPQGFSVMSEYNDVLTLHSGAKVNVQTFQGMVQSFMAQYGRMPATPIAPILSINGAGVGAGWAPNMYNTPGMTNQNLTQFEQSSWGSYGSSTPYNTPGVGTGGGGNSPPILGNWSGGGGGYRGGGGAGGNVIVQLMADGKILAQVVNAYNAQYLLNSGQSIDQVPIIQ